MTRKLAAIIAADVVGYSRLMGTDEVGTLGAPKTHRRELIDLKIAEHQGRIVKTTGDDLLHGRGPARDARSQCGRAFQSRRNVADPLLQARGRSSRARHGTPRKGMMSYTATGADRVVSLNELERRAVAAAGRPPDTWEMTFVSDGSASDCSRGKVDRPDLKEAKALLGGAS